MSVNSKMTAIADNIRSKTGGVTPLTLDGMAAGVNDVYEAGQSIGRDVGFTDGYSSGYEAGKASMIDQSKIIEKTVSGSIISVDDVSEIPHEVAIQLSSDTVTDFSAVTVKVLGKNLATAQQVWKGAANYAEMVFEGRNVVKFRSSKTFENQLPIFEEQTQYVFSFDAKIWSESGATNDELVLRVFYSDGTYSHIIVSGNIDWTHYTLITNAGKTVTAIGHWSYHYTHNIYVDVDTFQLEKATVASEYEPYQEQTAIANPDGTVEGITSISPNMTVFTDNADVNISMDYHKSYGMQTERDRFMDGYLANVTDGCAFMFAGNCWNDRSFLVVENQKIVVGSSAYGMFWGTGIKDLIALCEQYNVVIDFSQCAYFAYLVRETVLTTFPEIDTRSSTSIANLFYSALHVHTIKKIILKGDGSQTINSYSFYNLQSLEQITFEGVIGRDISFQWSTKLSKASIINIFEHLSTTATFTATFSKTAVTNAFGGTDSTEWTNLVATRPNVTISLV